MLINDTEYERGVEIEHYYIKYMDTWDYASWNDKLQLWDVFQLLQMWSSVLNITELLLSFFEQDLCIFHLYLFGHFMF